jgi:hypothetical protein
MANDNKGINPAALGLAGAIIGAVAGAVAIALSDKDNRKKFQQKVNTLRTEGSKKLDGWRDKAQELEQETKKKLATAEEKTTSDKTT